MRRSAATLTALALAAALGAAGAAAAEFDRLFTGATMRLDLYHSGGRGVEHLALESVRIEGPWPGSRHALLDPTNLGKYFLEVADGATQELIYSRGFAGIYGEWETTAEAEQTYRTFQEAVRLPEPRRPVQVRVRKRAPDGTFREIWTAAIDPASRFVRRPPLPEGRVRVLLEHGEPAEKVDLLLLGDGYTAEEMERFHADASRLAEELFTLEPFASARRRFNVRALETPADYSGISRPRSGVFVDPPLGTSYNSLDSERYVLTLDDRKWRDAAAAAPYDFVLILVNSRKYGGGGIHNLYATATAGSAFSPYLAIHEFGHHFAGLGDEYYTSEVSYEDFYGQRVEPWEPNLTALLDPENLKWGDLVTPGTPLPTPWPKEEFEHRSREFQEERRELRRRGAPEEELESLFARERDAMTSLLAAAEHAGAIGAFEGAGYQARGLYRPAADCIMFTRDPVGFCAVCRRAIQRVIDLYSD